MNLSSARRFALVLTLGASSLALTGIARADGVTGTDPVPRGCGCTGSVATTPAPASTPSGSAADAVISAVLAAFGIF